MIKYEIIISFFYKIFKRDKRYEYYTSLCSNLKLNRKEVIELQNKAIEELIKHAYTSTVYYKELMDSIGLKPTDIKTKEDLIKLPPLTKQIVKDNISQLTSNDDFGQRLKKVTSGGSTGEQAVIYRSKYYEAMSRASWLRNNSMIGWMPTDKSAWVWPSRTEYGNLERNIRARVGTLLNRRIFFNAYNYAESDFFNWHKRILKFKPKVIYGFSSIILEFAEFLLKNNLQLPSVKMVVSTSEKLKNREVMEQAFNCPVYNQYGCGEVLAIGIELNKDEMVFTDDVVVANTDSENQFLLTPLHSFGFPLINYKVADVGIIESGVHINSMYPFPEMNLKIGRMSDFFLMENNRKVSSVAYSGHLSTLNLGVKRHQIIQNNYKEFTVNYIATSSTDKGIYRKKITASLEKYFGKKLKIKFNSVFKIPMEKSGKRLLFKRTFKLDV